MKSTSCGPLWSVAIVLLLIGSADAQAEPAAAPRAEPNPTTVPEPYIKPAVPAFPGAEGYGSMSIGGRGGRVIKVTNLNASGPGSLAEACAAEGPRVVVFDVSGVISMPGGKGGGKLLIKHPHITIAGQTAPGAGITLEGYLSTQGMLNIHDVTVRFLRIRPRAGKGNNRTFEFNGGAGTIEHSKIIVDHCSMSWGADDSGSFCVVNNITAQWCSFEESDIHLEGGDEPHNFGAMFGPYGHGQATMHHCLFAHHHDRAPLTGADPLDYRNNVLYNVATGLITHPFRMNHRSPGKKFDINMVANYCKGGPGAIVGPRLYRPPYTLTTPSVGPVQSADAYVQGNYHDWRGGFVQGGAATAERPFDTPPVACQPADEAYQLVLAAGGCLPRDAVSKRTIHEVRTGTGEWGRHEPDGGLMEGLTPGKPRPDADNDGMPDDWETANGLNSNDPADAARIVPAGASKADRHAGYTYIEYYINELADDLMADAIVSWRLAEEPTKASDFGPANKLLTPLLPAEEIVAAIKEQSNAAVKAAAGDKYAYTRTDKAWYAIQMLSRMARDPKAGDPSPCVPPLIDVLSSDDTRSVVFAVYGLGAIGPSAKAAVPALSKVLECDYGVANAKWNFCPNGWAAWALGRIGPDARDAVPALTRAMESKDVWAHEQAAWALSRMGPAAEPAVDALVSQLNSPSLAIRTHVATALANIGKPAVATLVAMLDRCKYPASAAEAAGLIGPAAGPATPDLMDLAASADPAVRSAASVALCWINPQAGGNADLIRQRIDDKDVMVRYNVIVAVGRCGPAAINCRPALVKALGDANESVRGAAADALAAVGAADELVKAFSSEHGDVRARAARAAGRVKPDATILKALPGLLTDQDAGVRFEAAVALARLVPGEPGANLRQAANDDDFLVRAAVRAAMRPRNNQSE